MIILFVSECEHQAFTIARRILNRYATQIGRRTWMARLSEEGLRHIHSELKNKVTRQMSVSCHRVHGNQRTTLEWIIGTRKHFNAEGVYAFSWTRRDMLQAVIEPTPMERAARYITELAALFHDLGKATQFFQDKLHKNSKTGDPIRHEYVSWLMLEQMFGQPENDGEWLEKLTDRQKLFSWLQETFTKESYTTTERTKIILKAIQKNADSPAHGSLFQDDDAQQELLNKTPLLFALAWLILSHHRLPAADSGELDYENIVFDFANHTYHCQEATSFNDCLRPFYVKKAIWIENTWWTEQIIAKATQLRNLFRAQPDYVNFTHQHEQHAWLAFLTHYCRVMLMLGDHLISSAKQCFTGPNKDTLYFANTKSPPYCQASTLNEHLRGVGKESGSFLRLGLRLMDTLPGIDPIHLPSGLREIYQDKTSPYYWQDDACLKIKKRINDQIQGSGFFGIVIARTGSGKTRACARIMVQLSTRVRYNLALGLRTLTLQSGTAYRNELDLNKAQVSTLVGSEIVRRFYEMNQEKSAGDQGSESSVSDQMKIYSMDGDQDVDQELPPQLEQLLAHEPKKRQLITAPILVSTIDYLAVAANANRSKHLYATLRLMTADIVLDEVDSYIEEDLIVLGKLIYLCGLFGRKVLLASATLPPAIAENFFRAYSTGYQQYCLRKQKPLQIFAGWFSDYAELSQVALCHEVDAFKLKHTKITSMVIEKLHEEVAKRRALVLPLEPVKSKITPKEYSLDPVFHTVFQQCISFHQQHAVVDESSKKNISIGLVRWANTAACWRFAEFLLKQQMPAQIDHRVLCYHAKLLPVLRFEIEKTLDQMLKRNSPISFLEDKIIRNLLENSPARDVMIIVSATPIEEIGRDHDFDWAIIEPSSTRAIIQTAGRVRRHRAVSENAVNIALLSHTMCGLKGEALAFHHPGVESKAYSLGKKESREVYDLSLLELVIDARLLLVDNHAQSPITALEHQKLSDWLTGKTRPGERKAGLVDLALVGLVDFLADPLLAMTSHHAEHNRFRRSAHQLLYWLTDQDGNWLRKCEQDKEGVSSNELIDKPKGLDCSRYLLWNHSGSAAEYVEELYHKLQQQLYPDGEETISRQQLLGIEINSYHANDNSPQLWYHPLLGVYRK